MRRLLILMYGRRRKRLRQWMHGVGGGMGVAPRFLSLGLRPFPRFLLSCKFLRLHPVRRPAQQRISS